MWKAAASMLLVGTLYGFRGEITAAEPERKDGFDNPLPAGAVARLGTTGLRLFRPDDPLDLAPDGLTYAQAEGPHLYLRSTKTGRLVREWKAQPGEEENQFTRQRGYYLHVRFTPDGQFLQAIRGHSWLTYDVKSGKEVGIVPLQTQDRMPKQMTLSGNGKRLACVEKDFLEASVAVREAGVEKVLFALKLDGLQGCSATLSPDGKLLAAWGRPVDPRQKTAKPFSIREVDTGKERPALPMQETIFGIPVFAPDGRHLAALTMGGLVVWDLQSSQVVKQFVAGKETAVLWYSPDGKSLLAGSAAGFTRIWDTTTDERRIYRGPAVLPEAVRWLPDGKILALGRKGLSICIWEVVSGKVLTPQEIHMYPIEEVVFARDGRSLLSVAEDGLRSWNLAGLTDHQTAIGLRCQHHVTFERHQNEERLRKTHGVPLPDGTLLRRAEGCVELTEALTGRTIRPFRADWSTPLLASDDGKTLMMQANENAQERCPSRILVWNVQRGRVLLDLPTPVADSCEVAVSADYQVLALAANRPKQDQPRFPKPYEIPNKIAARSEEDWKLQETELSLWDLNSGKETRRRSLGQETFGALALTPDGKLLASATSSGGVELRDLELNIPYSPLENKFHPEQPRSPGSKFPYRFEKLKFSPDGRLLLGVPYYPGELLIWEVATGKLRHHWVADKTKVEAVAFSPDGHLLASGGSTGALLLWDLSSRLTPPAKAGQKQSAEQLQKLWHELQSPNPGTAFQAMSVLLHVPEQAVALFLEHVKPAEGKVLDEKEIARQILALDDEEFDVREKASAALTKYVRAARKALVRARANEPSLEQKRRLDIILSHLQVEFPPPELLGALRAVEVLERLNNPAARVLLQALASGRADDRITLDAKAALARLSP